MFPRGEAGLSLADKAEEDSLRAATAERLLRAVPATLGALWGFCTAALGLTLLSPTADTAGVRGSGTGRHPQL